MDCLISSIQMMCESNVNDVIRAVQRQLVYPFSYTSNKEKLTNSFGLLKLQIDHLRLSVAAAARNVEVINPEVQEWLASAERISILYGEFFTVENQTKSDCCNGRCPNLMTRFQLSKRAHRLQFDVQHLIETATFTQISIRVPIQGIGTEMSNEGYEAFESRRSIFEGIMEALKDENINMIGVYGMGGEGKTTLVKEVATQAMKINLFEVVVMVVVSEIPDHENIQRDMAEKLGLQLDQKNEFLRSDRIRMRLEQEKKILVIIDDIWERLDLKALGIYFGVDQKGCKILVTSRSRDVICNAMGIETNFHVGDLGDNEATHLFEKIVGISSRDSNFQPIMAEVIEQCGGLPIAITVVACALKNKELFVWKDALQHLKMSVPTEIEEMLRKVYMSIKLSYDFLGSTETKSLFLLCSAFGDDSDINIEVLVGYSVHLRLFHNICNMEQATNRVLSLVKKLKDCCLLLDGSYKDTVKMHDVIRHVAIYIAKENVHFRKWPKQDEGCSNNVPYPGSPKERGVTNNECYVSFESREVILEKVMKMLANDSTQTIGVHGSRGTGKTMIVNEIARQAKEHKLFDEVVMVDASRNTSLKMIQKEIADQLGIREESEFVTVDSPSDRLKAEKNILVIIDDVSEEFDLNAIKSFLGDHRMRCKALTTSLYMTTLDKMGVADIFSLPALVYPEAWFLFKKILGEFGDAPDFKAILRSVTKECAGLPLAISIIAYALKSRNIASAWLNALELLQLSRTKEILFRAIKVSYNLLESEEAKALFFLCSLVGGNGDIYIDHLTGYALRLGLFQDLYLEEASAQKNNIYLVEEARKRVHKLVEILKVQGFLLGCENSGTVKMSNSIRFMTQNYISDF